MRDPKELLHFAFKMKHYYRVRRDIGEEYCEIKGHKTLKLFKSWFRMRRSKDRLIYGFVTFVDGERWYWSRQSGWKRISLPRPGRGRQLVTGNRHE